MTIYKLWSSRKPNLIAGPDGPHDFHAETDKLYYDSDQGIIYVGDDENIPMSIHRRIIKKKFDLSGTIYNLAEEEHQLSIIINAYVMKNNDIKETVITVDEKNDLRIESNVDLSNHSLVLIGQQFKNDNDYF